MKTRKRGVAAKRTGQFEDTFKGITLKHPSLQFTEELADILRILRRERGFCPEIYLNVKRDLLNNYFLRNGIKGVVFGLSGGIDSSVVLAILYYCTLDPKCPLERIIPVMAPIATTGATGQEDATAKGQVVADHFKRLDKRGIIQDYIIDLKGSAQSIQAAVNEQYLKGRKLSDEDIGFTSGQLVSNTRIPAFYYLTALLVNDGIRSIVTGTINRDEGSYVGYFGKASDAVADIQIISDIHKSEVNQVAEHFNMPRPIVEQAPAGDVYSGLTDLEMMGFTYDNLEFITLLRDSENRLQYLSKLSQKSLDKMKVWSDRIEQRHRNNAFKYIVNDAAIHFDVYRRDTAGGMKPGNIRVNINGTFCNKLSLPAHVRPTFRKISKDVLIVDGLLTQGECGKIASIIRSQNKVTTDLFGQKDKSQASSYRCSTHSTAFADEIWKRLKPIIGGRTVIKNGIKWVPESVSPLLRFIEYMPGSKGLYPHYDYPFDKDRPYNKEDIYDMTGKVKAGRRMYEKTLLTLVIYISKNHSGSTDFIRDPDRYMDLSQEYGCRNVIDSPSANATYGRDWQRFAKPYEILEQVLPDYGRALLFTHEMLHAGQGLALNDRNKLIIRTDIMFKGTPIEECNEFFSIPANLKPWADLGLKPETIMSRQELIGRFSGLTDPYLQNHLTLVANRIYSSLILNVKHSIIDYKYSLLDKKYGYYNDIKGLLYKGGRMFDTNFMATPVYKVQRAIKESYETNNKELVVLLSSCGCAPMHEGHLNMFFEARRALQATGKYTVLGAYIAPDHSDYIEKKGIEKYSTMDRLLAAQRLCDTTDWVDIDPWSSLYLNTDINYTTNIDRLEEYLNKHIYTIKPIKVAYVYGSDHTGFGRSFIGRGIGICVLRKKEDLAEFKAVAAELEKYKDRILFVNPTNKRFLGLSSSKLRSLSQPEKRDLRLTLYYRDDIDWYIENMGADTVSYYTQFVNNVKGILAQMHADLRPIKDMPATMSEGDERGASPIYLSGCPPKSLACLRISRLFGVSSFSQNNIDFVAKPGQEPLDRQFARIKNLCKRDTRKKYLVEDDVATGRTLKYATRFLKRAKCKVSRKVKVDIDLQKIKTEPNETLDLLDFRDLLVGLGSGLVVLLPSGELGRAPYLLPYVNSAARIGFSADLSMEFSKLLWKENYKFFKNLEVNAEKTFRVADCKGPAAALFEYAAFNSDSTLSDICKYHCDMLE